MRYTGKRVVAQRYRLITIWPEDRKPHHWQHATGKNHRTGEDRDPQAATLALRSESSALSPAITSFAPVKDALWSLLGRSPSNELHG
jgi:hypothetical protein